MTTILPRRGTAAQWTAANPVLAMGEEGYETDTKKWKRGDGVTAWNALAYYQPTWAQVSGRPSVAASGVVGDGTADDRAALASSDTSAVSASLPLMLLPGTYRVASSLTISSPLWLTPGAVLKPANGAVITLDGGIVNTGQHQIIDMSLGGVVVPNKVTEFHPAWWGAIGTNNDSAVWNKMIISATYLPYRQTIAVPVGVNRLSNVELLNVHLEGYGRTRGILPAVGAVAGDPVVNNDGYIVKLSGSATISGIVVDTDSIAGMVGVFWTGSRCWMNGSLIKPKGTGTVGVWAYVSGGSITPKIINTWVEGSGSSTSGVGIRYQSPDGELSNVTVAYCSTGIELLKGSTVLNSVHIWECDTGVDGTWSGLTRMNDCYIETNFGWGATFKNTNNLVINKGTRFWKNGQSIANTGGLRIQGGTGTNKSKDCRIDAMFDDNVGVGLKLEDTLRTRGEVHFTSTEVIAGNAPLTTTGVVVDATSHGTDFTIIAPVYSAYQGGSTAYKPWTGNPFTNASTNSVISLGARIINTGMRGNNLATDGDIDVPELWADILSGTIVSTEQKYLGKNSIKIIGQSRTLWLLRTPWGSGNATYGAMTVVPGQTYRISAQVFRGASNTNSSGFYLSSTFTDSSGVNSQSTVDSYFAQNTISVGSWSSFSATFTAPAGRNLANMSFKTTSSVDPGDIFYIDSIKIDELGGNGFFVGTGVLDFGSVAAQSFVDLTITVTGAALGDSVALGVPPESITAGIMFTSWVSAANTVTVRANNYSAVAADPASGTFKATIVR